MKSVAPLAHNAATNKNAKTPGAKGLSAALFAVAGKGTGKTSLAAGAAAATKSGRPTLPSFSEVLRKGIASAATLKEKQPLKQQAPSRKATDPAGSAPTASRQSVAAHQTLNAYKEPATRDEKSDPKKKAATSVVVARDMAVTVSTAFKSEQATQNVGAPAHVNGEAQQQAVAAVSAKQAAPQQTQPTIRIVDLRKKQDAATGQETATSSKAAGPTSTQSNDQSVSFAQRLSTARDASTPAASQPPAASAASSQTPLERLRAMAGSELTQATTMILKDGGGEIRLILKPESLGSVRIRMNVVDNKVEGKIIVDSAAVKHVFDGSVDALRRALTAEGFQTGSLSVSVGGQGADTGEREQRQTPAEVQRIAAKGFERNVPGIETMSLGDLLVNVFV